MARQACALVPGDSLATLPAEVAWAHAGKAPLALVDIAQEAINFIAILRDGGLG